MPASKAKKLTCAACSKPVDPETGYRRFEGDDEEWYDCEACLVAAAPQLASPGFGQTNVDDQPAMMLVPAPPGFEGSVVDMSKVVMVSPATAAEEESP